MREQRFNCSLCRSMRWGSWTGCWQRCFRDSGLQAFVHFRLGTTDHTLSRSNQFFFFFWKAARILPHVWKMALTLFTTLTRSVQPFVPLDPAGKKVSMYCCGPTVYDFGHIGNFRTFAFSDLVRRFLEFRGYAVTHVMNITDVEDKIIARVRQAKIPLREYTAKYEAAFLEDLKTLGCLLPHHLPHATEHIPEMISLIEKLLARGFAYRTGDGSIYFSIEKYQGCGCRYGQLINLNFDQMRPGQRVQSDEYAKEDVAECALWKGRGPEDGGLFWARPGGGGPPGVQSGWSAMSMERSGGSVCLCAC